MRGEKQKDDGTGFLGSLPSSPARIPDNRIDCFPYLPARFTTSGPDPKCPFFQFSRTIGNPENDHPLERTY
jgi:hypothetical protein